eukprot:10804916-Lingulodinium_polyedra.AAC.1
MASWTMSSARQPACPAGSVGSQYAAGTTWRRTRRPPPGCHAAAAARLVGRHAPFTFAEWH